LPQTLFYFSLHTLPLGRSFILFAQNKRTKQKGTRYCLISKNSLHFMACTPTRYAQTRAHLTHKMKPIFSGNRRENGAFSNPPFVLTRSDIYSGLREASVWFVASMPLTLWAPPASNFVQDKFVSVASFSRPPESMLW